MRLLTSFGTVVALSLWMAAPGVALGDQSVQVGAQSGAAAGVQTGAGTGAGVKAGAGATAETSRGKVEGRAGAPVAAHISSNPALSMRLQPLLPAGMTIDAAARGFRNEGQFIASLHAATNLSIPFERLKAEVTGPAHDNLGQAIKTLKPSADARAEADKAERQAKADVDASTHTTVGQRIEANTALAARLRPMLPSGMTIETAATGFSNEGQFVAALHASTNLGIPFDQLKAKVVTARATLGQAIRDLKPVANSAVEAQKAEAQARADLQAGTNVEAENQDR